MQFFTNLFTKVDNKLSTFYTSHLDDVITYISSAIPLFATILVVGIGIGLMNGWIKQDAKPLLMGAFTITLVSLFAGYAGVYNQFLGDFLRGLPDELIGLVSTGNTTGVGQVLDDFGDSVIKGIQRIWENASGIGETAAAAVVCGMFFLMWVIMSIAAVTAILVAKIALTVLVVVGPLFIMFLLFPQTKDFFTKWLTYSLSFAFLAMLIGGFIAITKDIATNYFTDFSNKSADVDFAVYAGPMLVLYGLYKLFDNAPMMASSLSGGIGLSMGAGIAGAAHALTSPLRRAGSSAGNLAARKFGDATQGTKLQKLGNAVDPERRQAKKSARVHDKVVERRRMNRESRENK